MLPQVRAQTLRSHHLTARSLVGITFLEESGGLKILVTASASLARASQRVLVGSALNAY
jgi:hypothetical protein